MCFAFKNNDIKGISICMSFCISQISFRSFPKRISNFQIWNTDAAKDLKVVIENRFSVSFRSKKSLLPHLKIMAQLFFFDRKMDIFLKCLFFPFLAQVLSSQLLALHGLCATDAAAAFSCRELSHLSWDTYSGRSDHSSVVQWCGKTRWRAGRSINKWWACNEIAWKKDNWILLCIFNNGLQILY